MSVRRLVIRYRTRSEDAEENARLVAAVFQELEATAPAGLRYEAFREGDGSQFTHVAEIATEDGANPLQRLASFAAFQQGLGHRCVEPPVATPITLIARYSG